MASLKMNITHQLSQPEALSRVRELLGKLKQDQKNKISNVKESWNGDTGNFQFTAQGFDLSGVIRVNPSSVDIDADLPFALTFFKGKIRDVISEKANQLLSK